MKIAFVGKGGAGKTTTSTLFAQYYSEKQTCLAIDADINMHMAELLGAGNHDDSMLISEKAPSDEMRSYLRGTNSLIASNDAFKKSTPPGQGSNLINVTDSNDWLIARYSMRISDTLRLMTVGSYSEAGIASSCYHNNLAILENVLSHTRDNGTIVVDMVAGTDAFASTLFAQFDALVFVVEPTKRGLAVLEDYIKLAKAGGVAERLLVVANKVEDEDDERYVQEAAGARYAGALSRSAHLRAVDKGSQQLDFSKLTEQDRATLATIAERAESLTIPAQERLPSLWSLHETYVSQGYVKQRFGDLTTQIDPNFVYES
jgi:CO dehydrogenase maturation factor